MAVRKIQNPPKEIRKIRDFQCTMIAEFPDARPREINATDFIGCFSAGLRQGAILLTDTYQNKWKWDESVDGFRLVGKGAGT